MSKLEEYRDRALDERNSGFLDSTVEELADLADAAIAELEADNDRLAESRKTVPFSVDRKLYYDRWVAAQARIAGLEAAYNDVVAVNENELALRLEAEAEVARLRKLFGMAERGTK